MEIILSGLLVNLLTYLSKRLNLSGTVMSLILSLAVGLVYYIFINYYSTTYEEILNFVSGVYAVSQVVYNVIIKIYPTQQVHD